jgi:hypothetical protein
MKPALAHAVARAMSPPLTPTAIQIRSRVGGRGALTRVVRGGTGPRVEPPARDRRFVVEQRCPPAFPLLVGCGTADATGATVAAEARRRAVGGHD